MNPVSATAVAAPADWLPPDQVNARVAAASVAAPAAPASWAPPDLHAELLSPAAAPPAATSRGIEWIPPEVQSATAVGAAAAGSEVAPHDWLVESGDAQASTGRAAPVETPTPGAWVAAAAANTAATAATAAAAKTAATAKTAAAANTAATAATVAPASEAQAVAVAAPRPNALLRLGLPLAVVAVSLVVAFAIAGVFHSTPVAHPVLAHAGAPSTPPARPGATAKPAIAAHRSSPARSRGSAPHRAARNPQPRKVVSHTAPASAPHAATRPVAPVTAPRAPVTVAPAPVHPAPAAPQHATPPQRHISQTRPTHRSGGPGRQPTSG